MKPELIIERINSKPERKISNSDLQLLLLIDIKNLLEKLVSDSGKPETVKAESWFKKVFK
jgi:hypothetical protein